MNPLNTPATVQLPAHSAAHLGAHRNHWWNPDYLQLLAGRLTAEHAPIERFLDLGCGKGQWGELVSQHIAPHSMSVGLDRELRWLRQHADPFKTGLVAGSGDALPFGDGVFDLVTCQTVLMHLTNPARALAEVARVLRPGGLFLAVEPNNRATHMVRSSAAHCGDLERTLRGVAFYVRCEHGKAQLGDGDSSIGDRLPGLFHEAGFSAVNTWINDKSFPLAPPYEDPGQQVWREQLIEWADDAVWTWSENKSRRYFIAGGGTAAEFDQQWPERLEELQQEASDLRAGDLTTAGGRLMYLVAGRKAGAA